MERYVGYLYHEKLVENHASALTHHSMTHVTCGHFQNRGRNSRMVVDDYLCCGNPKQNLAPEITVAKKNETYIGPRNGRGTASLLSRSDTNAARACSGEGKSGLTLNYSCHGRRQFASRPISVQIDISMNERGCEISP